MGTSSLLPYLSPPLLVSCSLPFPPSQVSNRTFAHVAAELLHLPAAMLSSAVGSTGTPETAPAAAVVTHPQSRSRGTDRADQLDQAGRMVEVGLGKGYDWEGDAIAAVLVPWHVLG